MKVLSLKEPWATLIKEGIKKVETRSWKTNYRGKLYIHASSSSIPKNLDKEFASLIKDFSFNYGNIICECELVDCIYMTDEYIKNIKETNHLEYICGEYKIGRYAWILKDIKPLKELIKAKGKLNIWEYKK